MTPLAALERAFERLMFSSRWLLAPFYLGLIVTLAMLLVRFGASLFGVIEKLPDMSDTDMVLAALKLIDLSLVANLLLVVILAGYENFVSRLQSIPESERAGWMGKVDFSGIKIKLIGSIVAISAIHLLEDFLSIHDIDKTDLAWMLGVHAVFIASGVVLAVMDRLAGADAGSH
jgi:uncharacterized protein (TIGR00645 family)